MPDLDTRLRAAKEHFDTLLRGALLLGTVNSAGLLTFIGMFKDYIHLPPILTPGLFVTIFGAGLLSSVLLYVGLALSKVELLQALVSEEPEFTRMLSPMTVVGAIGAFGAPVVAFGIAVYRFSSL